VSDYPYDVGVSGDFVCEAGRETAVRLTNQDRRMPSFYRFRSITALLGEWQELERQEIYFSPPDELNDPLEGFKDLFWLGDEIVWRNLLRHYLMCLMWGYVLVKIGGDYRETLSQEVPMLSRFLLPTPQARAIHGRICERFFGSFGIDEVPALLSRCGYRFRRDALEFVLRAVHPVAFDAVLHVYREDGLEKSPQRALPSGSETSPEALVTSMKHLLTLLAARDESATPDQLGILFSVGAHFAKQTELIAYLHATDGRSRAWLQLFASFTETYVDRLHHFIFFKWYAACFVADPNDAAMWAHYGDAHRGICLQFRATNNAVGKPTICLHGITGSSATRKESHPIYGDIPLTFQPVNYVDKLASIDFFRSLARVPVPDLEADWYVDDDGSRSECGRGAFTASREWIDSIWTAFLASTTAKLRYWEREAEYRLVLPSAIDMHAEREERKLRYNFADLEGIMFGIKTPLESKEQIIKTVLAKCQKTGRRDFKFSQASYAPYSGRIETRSMDLLRIP
jgi:hypothetical protein